jgi:FdhE protein
MTAAMLETGRWSERRRRAGDRAERWPFAAEVLAFYGALLDTQQRIYDLARERRPEPGRVAEFVAEAAFPHIIEVSIDRGPERLKNSVIERFHEADSAQLVRRWLDGAELDPVDRYVARASTSPVLEALDHAALRALAGKRTDERHCPACGGAPQVSYFGLSSEDLVIAHRYLECSRCAGTWAYARMTCASCGENDTTKLMVYSEVGSLEGERSKELVKHGAGDPNPALPGSQFPHMRIDGCRTCSRYLLTVDMARDGKAVPAVDELAALPLDLYAKELGLTKITPNLMGF